MFRKAILASVMAMGLIGPSGANARDEQNVQSRSGAEGQRPSLWRERMEEQQEEWRADRLREAARNHPRLPYSDLHLYD